MCGIAGLAGPIAQGSAATALVAAMTSAMVHRGPDGEGAWLSSEAPVALGQRRLAIIDLSPGGYQPRVAMDGRCALTYNGELYNYRELRAELATGGWAFESTSDTEVLLAGLLTWGPIPMLRRANGMFAFAFWDGRDRSLWLARDRFGEKPLYWSVVDRSVVFASELKALRPVPGFDTTIDRDALAGYFRYATVQAPRSIYRGTSMVAPGSAVQISVEADRVGPPRHVTYWDPIAAASEARQQPFQGSLTDAVDALDEVLGRSVAMRMVADVPLGAFLSGGVDSSTIVSLMRRGSSADVKTFTIGFTDERYNEAADALAVARHLEVDHTEFTVTSREALDVVPRLASMYDEPFADSSQIPTHIVSALARQHVTVALSGDAGDELFGGYNRYMLAESVWGKVGWLPAAVRRTVARGVRAVPPARLDSMSKPLLRLPPLKGFRGSPGDRIHKAVGLLAQPDQVSLYEALISCWTAPVVRGRRAPGQQLPEAPGLSFAERMMLCDTVGYLPNDILVKVDRAAMATSLETRVPILDPDVYRLAWSLPLAWRVGSGPVGKVVLRELLARYVPRPLFERPKTGFGVPLESWLRGPLRTWADDLLSPERLRAQGLLDVDLVSRTWAEHRSGRRNWQHLLWSVLMFQLWFEEWSVAPAATSVSR